MEPLGRCAPGCHELALSAPNIPACVKLIRKLQALATPLLTNKRPIDSNDSRAREAFQ